MGAGLLAGAVEAAGLAAGAAVAADSAEFLFFERLFLGVVALLSVDAAVLAAESSAADFFDFFPALAGSEVEAEAEVADASLLSAEADFFELLFLGVDEVELSAVVLSSAEAGFFFELLFLEVDEAELSAVVLSAAAADFLDELFLFEVAVLESPAAWDEVASVDAESAFFFLVFFLVVSVCV